MATTSSTPSTMKAWQSIPGTKFAQTFRLNDSAPLPKRKADTHLIQVIATSINPVDFKVVEIPFVPKLILPNPATPVLDFCGKIVQPAEGSNLKPGDVVFGAAGIHLLGGALAQYTIAKKDSVALLPSGLDPKSAATINVAGLTAYQSIKPFIREGSSIFINGGSGGTGSFGIQIAKALGCYVTTTCSTANVELCKELGADEVIDYKKQDIVQALVSSGRKYDHIVDNVGHDYSIFWKAHEYTTPKAVFVTVGGSISWTHVKNAILVNFLPAFLGGEAVPKTEDLAQVAQWMKEGRVKPIIDSEYKFEDAPAAFEKLRTERAKGKIIIEVESQA